MNNRQNMQAVEEWKADVPIRTCGKTKCEAEASLNCFSFDRKLRLI